MDNLTLNLDDSTPNLSEEQMAIRRKRKDTRIGTIEKKYNIDLGVRSDMKLGNYLKKAGYKSLSKLINKKRRKK